ncbi:prepilin peptidase, partial [Enterobacter hormaechei subsp. steigerwaltii]|nr:prepilin peptidase [Enterobacter hormaechei subsp. steigerwaltii]
YFAVNNLNKNNLTISFGPYLAFAGIVVFMSQQFAFTF